MVVDRASTPRDPAAFPGRLDARSSPRRAGRPGEQPVQGFKEADRMMGAIARRLGLGSDSGSEGRERGASPHSPHLGMHACAVCGSPRLRVDVVDIAFEGEEAQDFLVLAECPRCSHRFTRTISSG